MSKVCQITGARYAKVNRRKLLRGNMNPTAKRRQYPNLQKVTLEDGTVVRASARAIKSLYKENR